MQVKTLLQVLRTEAPRPSDHCRLWTASSSDLGSSRKSPSGGPSNDDAAPLVA